LYTKLAPFNWAEGNIARPKAVFDLESNGESVGRLQFELAHDVVPQTVTNFINLIKGEGPNNFTYKNSKLHLIRKGEVVMGGDVEGGSGKLSHSSFKERYFEDENFIIPHTARGLIR
jgi:cyclophilin family peptidyl-prolyl cis-trans isomerase